MRVCECVAGRDGVTVADDDELTDAVDEIELDEDAVLERDIERVGVFGGDRVTLLVRVFDDDGGGVSDGVWDADGGNVGTT